MPQKTSRLQLFNCSTNYTEVHKTNIHIYKFSTEVNADTSYHESPSSLTEVQHYYRDWDKWHHWTKTITNLSISAMIIFFTFTSGWTSAHATRKLLRVCRWNSSGKTWSKQNSILKTITATRFQGCCINQVDYAQNALCVLRPDNCDQMPEQLAVCIPTAN